MAAVDCKLDDRMCPCSLLIQMIATMRWQHSCCCGNCNRRTCSRKVICSKTVQENESHWGHNIPGCIFAGGNSLWSAAAFVCFTAPGICLFTAAKEERGTAKQLNCPNFICTFFWIRQTCHYQQNISKSFFFSNFTFQRYFENTLSSVCSKEIPAILAIGHNHL